MKFKNNIYWIPVFCLALFSCYDDKGNYDYRELNEIEITNIPEEIAVLANAENIVVKPKVVSKEEGEIKADNPNYSFAYYYNELVKDENGYLKCTVLDSTFSKDLNIPAALSPKQYTCWFEVTDNRTEVINRQSFQLTVASSITSGWMVLCNEGAERRVRMDMIGIISADREVVTHDILPNLPLSHGAIGIAHDPKFRMVSGPTFRVLTEDGGYKLNPSDFVSGPEYSMDYEFGDQTVHHIPVSYNFAYGYPVVVDKEGDIYMQGNANGAIFGMPFNVLKAGTNPTFKVSPYIGNLNSIAGAFLYNVTDGRFMMWYAFSNEIMMELPAPDPKLFDWNVDKELMYMSGTENNYGIYSLMRDKQGRYALYGVESVLYSYPPKYKQTLYQDGDGLGLEADHLTESKVFAFHPKLPYLFYAYMNEIWEYDYSTKQAHRVAVLGDKETVTMIKFNRFTGNYFNVPKPDEYFEMQYRLIVGTVDGTIEGNNNGILRFYDVPELNKNLVLYGKPYTGFAEIKDVVFREN